MKNYNTPTTTFAVCRLAGMLCASGDSSLIPVDNEDKDRIIGE